MTQNTQYILFFVLGLASMTQFTCNLTISMRKSLKKTPIQEYVLRNLKNLNIDDRNNEPDIYVKTSECQRLGSALKPDSEKRDPGYLYFLKL